VSRDFTILEGPDRVSIMIGPLGDQPATSDTADRAVDLGAGPGQILHP
jgi:hypothetical protein